MRQGNRSRHGKLRIVARSLGAVAFACGLMVWSSPALAASGAWQSIGPEGGGVEGLAVDPSTPATLYAAAGEGGLYKTADGGRSWIHSDTGLLPNDLLQVVIDPVVTSTVYAATAIGVWRSGDGGTTWMPPGSGLANAFVYCVAIDPLVHRTLYAATANQVWKSVDGAASWMVSGKAPAPPGVSSLAIDPRQPATIYAGTGQGIFKSTNGGRSWKAAQNGMGPLTVLTVTVDPKHAGTVWVGTRSQNFPQRQGLYVSRNSGGTWTHLALPAGNLGVSCVAVPPAGHPLYACAAGLWTSADGGRTWQPIDAGLPAATNFGALVLDPTSPDVLYVSGGSTVYKSTTGGSSWQPAGNGIKGAAVAALAVDPQDAGTLYGIIGGTLLKSTDDGVLWAPAQTGLQGIAVETLAINPLAPSTLYAETNRAFFATNDGGGQWFRPGPRFEGGSLLVVDPQTPATLFSTAFDAGFVYLYGSIDSGASWTRLGSSGFGQGYLALAVAPSSPSTLYVATDETIQGNLATGLFVSHDGGASFESINGFRQIAVIAVDPQDPDTLYVSGSSYPSAPGSGLVFGVWKSQDGGQTFAQLPGVVEMESMLIDPVNPQVIYGGSGDIMYSDAGGNFMASFVGGNVLVSRDGGETWSQLAAGLPGAPVSQLAFGPAGTLYAGTRGASIYRLSLGAP